VVGNELYAAFLVDALYAEAITERLNTFAALFFLLAFLL
jgi:hypothetical protein